MDSSVQCNSITADKSRQSVAVFRRLLFKRVCMRNTEQRFNGLLVSFRAEPLNRHSSCWAPFITPKVQRATKCVCLDCLQYMILRSPCTERPLELVQEVLQSIIITCQDVQDHSCNQSNEIHEAMFKSASSHLENGAFPTHPSGADSYTELKKGGDRGAGGAVY
jgi:hypothetical protein